MHRTKKWKRNKLYCKFLSPGCLEKNSFYNCFKVKIDNLLVVCVCIMCVTAKSGEKPYQTLTLLTWLDNPNYEAEALLQKSKIRKQIMPSWYERLSRKPNVVAATPFCFQKIRAWNVTSDRFLLYFNNVLLFFMLRGGRISQVRSLMNGIHAKTKDK